MNKDFEQDIKKLKEDIALSAHEKSALRAEFDAFLSKQPVAIPTPYSFTYTHRWVLSALAIILMCGTTSVSAESSLPGDLLYGIKTNVNEKVYESVAFTPEMKATTNINIANKRLNELETVIAQNKTDPEDIAYLKDNLVEHTDAAVDAIQDLNDSNNIDDAVHSTLRLQTVLQTHSDIIDNLDDSTTNSAEHESAIDDVQAAIDEKTDQVNDLSDQNIVDASSTPTSTINEIVKDAENDAQDEKVDIIQDAQEEFGATISDVGEENASSSTSTVSTSTESKGL